MNAETVANMEHKRMIWLVTDILDKTTEMSEEEVDAVVDSMSEDDMVNFLLGCCDEENDF